MVQIAALRLTLLGMTLLSKFNQLFREVTYFCIRPLISYTVSQELQFDALI